MLEKQNLKILQFSKQDLIKFCVTEFVGFSILYNSHAAAGKEEAKRRKEPLCTHK